jgi:hypothetical protein|nr:MAG TPA: hypothetical protein [Caudoviricetes sp.]
MILLQFKALLDDAKQAYFETPDQDEIDFLDWLSRDTTDLFMSLPNGRQAKVVEVYHDDLVLLEILRGQMLTYRLSEWLVENISWLVRNNTFAVRQSLTPIES